MSEETEISERIRLICCNFYAARFQVEKNNNMNYNIIYVEVIFPLWSNGMW